MINVNKPFLPPLHEYQLYVEQIWERNCLTNNGPLVIEFENKLKEYLDVDNVIYLNNGTTALQIAIKALELKGEIITTPFSFVATTSTVVWEGCTPVFADIDPFTLNIDPLSIESLITDKTSGILATHVYGNPCDIDIIQAIADKYGLKVIFDGAHCFGTKYKGKSVFAYGDVTTTSFHSTKLFHTIEGGAVFTNDPELFTKMAFMRNFGFNGPEDFAEVGINGKNSEFHAAMGLVNLKYADLILQKRREQSERYDQQVQKLNITRPHITEQSVFNYSYYPVMFQTEADLLASIDILTTNNVFPRRYFYPSLNKLKYVSSCHTPVCDNKSSTVLCLPLYYDLTNEQIDLICRLLLWENNNPAPLRNLEVSTDLMA